MRNFCIIAHIDHGKSTLADRLLERTGTIAQRQMVDQILDDMPLERERGITIKSHAIQMKYGARDGNAYTLNLIDTPGHVDFSYEVSRSLAACEGAILVVDASQGVEAQTISNVYMAVDAGLEIVPVINKIDLPSAMVEDVKKQLVDLIGCKEEDILLASAKAKIGIDEVLEAVVNRIPPPAGNVDAPTRALIFDAKYDSYRGVVTYIRIVDGVLKTNDKVSFHKTGKVFLAEEVGVLEINRVPTKELEAGNVGYLIAGVKELTDARVGDTVMNADNEAHDPLPGYREVKPMVFSGLYPAQSEHFEELRDALAKFKLNDAALLYEPETSTALGFGFRCGFLGLLHMEIVQERLEREFNQTIITTVPNVEYKVVRTNKEVLLVDNPAAMPSPAEIDHIEEPYVTAQIICPSEFIGNVMKLCMDRRGVYKNTTYIDTKRADIRFELPLAEIVFDFFDKLKSLTRGYASFDYEYLDTRESDLVKLDILLNGEVVDALSSVVHREKSYDWGRKLSSKLRKLIPKQLFEVVIQAAIGSKIIARESISPIRKNVIAKCYGGDITRKRKLLEKQKEGKKRMKQIGRVEVPQEAFLAVLSLNEEE
ncbi:MAG: translation elongation factor 4 [Bacteroidetes bacterium]|nr:translation elongation factor 4 [Bacteroidota bacterium]